MKLNVVIGNPPYNRGLYLDFVNLGFHTSTELVCMVTPAKWQMSDDSNKIASKTSYNEFRRNIVPHIRKVVFYPDCLDVFGIAQTDGISYYLINKDSTYEDNCTVVNKCNLQNYMNSECVRDITKQQTLWNIGNEIVEYLGCYPKYNMENPIIRKRYTVNINRKLMNSLTVSGAWNWDTGKIRDSYIGKGGFLFNGEGSTLVLSKYRILEDDETSESADSKDIFTSSSIEECESFISYLYTKFIRFLILVNINSTSIIKDNTFRFVPAPPSGKFDHIYTDEELYNEFNLPQKYIDVIESIIRERKQ